MRLTKTSNLLNTFKTYEINIKLYLRIVNRESVVEVAQIIGCRLLKKMSIMGTGLKNVNKYIFSIYRMFHASSESENCLP